MIMFQERYNSEESLEDNQSTTSSTESRQSDFAKKEHEFIPTRRYAKLYCMVLNDVVWYGMVWYGGGPVVLCKLWQPAG